MSKVQAFTMPKWGIEMSEGHLAEWMVKEGESFTKGQVLALVETDKITNEIEAEQDGVIRRILAPAGGTYAVGELLAVMAPADVPDSEVDAFIASFKPADTRMAAASGQKAEAKPAAAPAAAAPAAAPAPKAVHIPEDLAISPQARLRAAELQVDVTRIKGSGRNGRITAQDVEIAARPPRAVGGGAPVSIAPTTADYEDVFASPMAKRLAVMHGVDLRSLQGSGPRGRIRKCDVLAAVEAAGGRRAVPSGEVQVIRMTPMRKTIARRLTESKQNVPHFYVRVQARADRLVEVRRIANLALGAKASINDYLVKACALALTRVPEVNIQVHGDEIHRFPNADISIAVATPKGLLTPVVRAADLKSIPEIAAETRALIDRAQAGRLQAHEFEGGSFSLSNLGMFGIDQFDAIINPPQGAILAVGAVRPQPIEENGALRMVPMISLSLSCDHRAIDGADGARFLATLREIIEAPEQLLER